MNPQKSNENLSGERPLHPGESPETGNLPQTSEAAKAILESKRIERPNKAIVSKKTLISMVILTFAAIGGLQYLHYYRQGQAEKIKVSNGITPAESRILDGKTQVWVGRGPSSEGKGTWIEIPETETLKPKIKNP